MATKNKRDLHWPLVLCSLGTAIVLAACASGASTTATAALTPLPTKTVSLRLENGAAEVQDE